MLGAENQRPTSPDGTHMAPIMAHGLATNSIGYLVTDDNAMVWRGPMASKALMQMLQETMWPDLDYLVLDMPPGTGDIQLTLAQNIPVTGAVVVTTPQDIALIDAKKGIVMFEKVEVPVLGIVENMSMHICSNCGHHEPSLVPVAQRNWLSSITPNCWARCRCTLRCVKIWTAVNRRS
jgi:ATP-binding protein involved in chromosome partitioning